MVGRTERPSSSTSRIRRQDGTLYLVSADGASPPVPFLHASGLERYGVASPDGRWIAYYSDLAGRMELFVQSFPAPGAKYQVSNGGANDATTRWTRGGKELMFMAADGLTVMSAEVATGASFHAGEPRAVQAACRFRRRRLLSRRRAHPGLDARGPAAVPLDYARDELAGPVEIPGPDSELKEVSGIPAPRRAAKCSALPEDAVCSRDHEAPERVRRPALRLVRWPRDIPPPSALAQSAARHRRRRCDSRQINGGDDEPRESIGV